MFENFWWGNKDKGSKIHWLNWQKMGNHKANGGMGFRKLECFKKALLAKQLWRILTHPQSLVVVVLREKYCKDGSVLNINAKAYNSLLWKSLLAAREAIKGASRWRVGNGKRIKIWEDIWLPTRDTFQVQSPNTVLPRSSTVNELFNASGFDWNEEMIKNIFWEDEAKAILKYSIRKQ